FLSDLEQHVLAADVLAVHLGEPRGRVEEELARAGPGVTVELARGCGDRGLHLDLRRVLRGQGGELGRELGAPRRQAREDGALLVDEVTGDRALEVRDG